MPRILIAFAVVVAVLALGLLLSDAIKYIGHHMSYTFESGLDPQLKEIKYPAIIYVAAYSYHLSDLPQSKVKRVWRFGEIVVVKYLASSYQEVKRLKEMNVIVSALVPDAVEFPEPFRRVMELITAREIRQTLPIAISFSKDAKKVFHDVTYRWLGKNVTICIVDSGVDYLHPDLRDNIYVLVSMLARKDGRPMIWVRGVNGTLEDAWKVDRLVYNITGMYAWMDENGHGTHVAGILVASGRMSNGLYRGFVPAARLVMIKSFDREGRADVDVILDSLEWIYENGRMYGIDLCSFSWGMPKASDGNDPIGLATSQIVKDRNIIVVVAAGNSFFFPYTINIPASCKYCIAVGAMNPYTYTVEMYSSSGPTADGRIKPDFVGAGTHVVSTMPVTVRSLYEEMIERYRLPLKVGEHYCYMTGTSMAAPAVAGIAAKVIEYMKVHKMPISYDSVMEMMIKWTRRINPVTKDIWTGYGVPVELG